MSVIQEVQIARERVKLMRKQYDLRRKNGLAFYEPSGRKHEAFHYNADKKYRFARTGNRFGKSEMGAAEDIAWLVGERTWLPKDDPRRYVGVPRRSTRGLLIVANWKKANEIFTNRGEGQSVGKLFKYLPEGNFIRVINPNGNIEAIQVRSNWGGVSTLYIQTVVGFKQDEMSSESSQFDFIHVDEPIPRPMWVAVSRGLMDTNGSAWFTCTPIAEPWINDFFFPRKGLKRLETSEEPIVIGNRFIVLGSTYDNKHLTKESIEEYIKTLKPDEVKSRIYGLPSSKEGVVYPEFEWDKHVYTKKPYGWKSKNDPPKDYTIRVAIDPHSSTPKAVLYAATSPHGYTYFYNEYFEPERISAMCIDIQCKTENRHLFLTICDPIAYIESPVDGSMWVDEMNACGVYPEKAPKDLQRGIDKVKEELSRRDENGNPYYYFSDELTETLFEFENYVWDPDKPNKPKDENDHMMENLYRLMLSGVNDYVDMSNSGRSHYEQSEVGFDPTIPVQGDYNPMQEAFDNLTPMDTWIYE